ncbi:MAG: cytochrome c biogenesis protein CcsA [Bacteroidetes bacterium]|nr:cytochrome c biogenesis protein CcsA [Bacteroidota bacterium]
MEQLAQKLFSMRMMAFAMIVFLLAIGTATFIESAYDIQAAKLVIYNALWFEILLVYLSVNLITNIFRYQMWHREKIATLTFHVSFIVILIGAGITRYISFEGLMLIREGSTSDFIYSSDPHLWLRINDGKMQYTSSEKMFQSDLYHNDFSYSIDFPKHKTPIKIEFLDFKKKQIDSLVVNDSIQGKVLEIVSGGMTSNYLEKGGFLTLENTMLTFDDPNAPEGFRVFEEKGALYFESVEDVSYLPMAKMQKARELGLEVSDSAYVVIPKNTKSLFQTTTLYRLNDEQFVFKGAINHAKKMLVSSGRRDIGTDYLFLKVTDGKESKEVRLEGGMGQIPGLEVFSLNGLSYEMEYGSTKISLPFSIGCRDFQLDRYPGSDSPSSFASEVTIIDEKNKVRSDRRIYMNNVMDYGGYRFFQSAYDPDEKGTRLSVNHDWWGTNVSYLGYLLMFLGMVLSLFARNGRFKDLRDKLKAIQSRKELLILFVFLSAGFGFSQEDHSGHNHDQPVEKTNKIHRFMSEEQSDEIANLPIQDFKGRIIPVHTLCDQLLRKLSRNNTYEGNNAIQVVFSMHMYPEHWMTEPVVYVYSNLLESLGKKENYLSFSDLSDGEGRFKLEKQYNTAFQKLESKRNEFDKKVIKLGEKFQVFSQIFVWSYMKVIPIKDNPGQQWFTPFEEQVQSSPKAMNLARSFLQYLSAVDSSAVTNQMQVANTRLVIFKAEQRLAGEKVSPKESILNLEVSYNKMNVFKNTSYMYLLVGFALLLLYFFKIFKTSPLENKTATSKVEKIGKFVLIGTMLYHASGLIMRWNITGHAPWSNGYEAVIFIAWVTMIAGLIFSRKNGAVFAATAILAFLMIFVTEMNLMDPEITPLQPVLKSYWLMIHVAIITGSYGFLGLSAILSLLNLVLYITRNSENGKRITLHINELTYVSEMSMTIGLFMLTVGTFLGGIWANESWGRYWGWDPKETWALVSVLVYSVILHLRFIPKANSKFTFNVVGLWGYSAILFTFFGVNFYLVGLHSYAQGEGLGKIPNGLILTILLFVIFTFVAKIRNKKYKAKNG